MFRDDGHICGVQMVIDGKLDASDDSRPLGVELVGVSLTQLLLALVHKQTSSQHRVLRGMTSNPNPKQFANLHPLSYHTRVLPVADASSRSASCKTRSPQRDAERC